MNFLVNKLGIFLSTLITPVVGASAIYNNTFKEIKDISKALTTNPIEFTFLDISDKNIQKTITFSWTLEPLGDEWFKEETIINSELNSYKIILFSNKYKECWYNFKITELMGNFDESRRNEALSYISQTVRDRCTERTFGVEIKS